MIRFHNTLRAVFGRNRFRYSAGRVKGKTHFIEIAGEWELARTDFMRKSLEGGMKSFLKRKGIPEKIEFKDLPNIPGSKLKEKQDTKEVLLIRIVGNIDAISAIFNAMGNYNPWGNGK